MLKAASMLLCILQRKHNNLSGIVNQLEAVNTNGRTSFSVFFGEKRGNCKSFPLFSLGF